MGKLLLVINCDQIYGFGHPNRRLLKLWPAFHTKQPVYDAMNV